MPKSIEEFEKLKDMFNYIKYQYEKGDNQRLHAQVNLQAHKATTMKAIKKKLNDNTLHLEKTRGTFCEADDYCGKIYNRCKIHKSCKCDYFDIEKICELCNKDCVRSLARWDDMDFTKEYPFTFGDPVHHRALTDKKKEIAKIEKINIESIPEIRPVSEDIIRSTTKKTYTTQYKPSDFIIPSNLQQWVNENILTKNKERYKSLLLIGKSRIGKTELMRTYGKHVYWCNTHNLATWDDDAEYVILDNFQWNFNKGEYKTTKFDTYKGMIGCQKQFEMTDKYQPKKTINGSIPCIILCNPDQNLLNALDNNQRKWFNLNVTIIDLKEQSLIPIQSSKHSLDIDSNNESNKRIRK
nr:10651_t:CDS:1 [Entrophospora candida]CAG8687549.1 3003_t:CDS:1 [Entrophospora candida]